MVRHSIASFALIAMLAGCLSGCGRAQPSQEQTAEDASEPTNDNDNDNADVAEVENVSEPTGGENVGDEQSISAERKDLRKFVYASESKDSAQPQKTGVIDPNSIDPYTRADYPEVVSQWGHAIPTINKERKAVAQIIIRDPRCDGVMNVQISDRSTTADHRYWADCNNLTRYYFDAASLKSGKPAHIQTQADMGNNGRMDW